jgi:hypothetical protein
MRIDVTKKHTIKRRKWDKVRYVRIYKDKLDDNLIRIMWWDEEKNTFIVKEWDIEKEYFN